MLPVSPSPLRRQLLIAIVLLLVPVLAVVLWLGYEEFRRATDELTEETRAAAQRMAAAIEREVIGLDRMARNMVSHPAVQNMEPAAAGLLRPQREQRPSLVDLALVDRDGHLIARANPASDIPDRWTDLAAPVLTHARRVVSPLEFGPSGQPYVTFAYPVEGAGGAVTGVLAYFVEPQLLQAAFRDSVLPDGSVVTLAEMSGRILARNVESTRYVGQVLTVAVGDGTGQPEERDEADGVRRMVSEAMVPGGPWIVTVGVPLSVASDRAVALWMRTLPVFVPVLGGWLLVALIFARRLTRPVAHLEAAAQRIAAGDFSALEQRPMPTREFAELQREFESMLGRFNETRSALDAQMAEERRMRQEVESLQRQVIRQERLAAVGQLVSGVAHEINNPLQAILGFAELLQMQHELPESVRNDLLLIQKESARACGIIRNLALFARQQTGDAEPVRLTDVIRSVAELRQRRLESENIELRIEDGAARPVLAVLTELQQVALNFVVNAEQAVVMSGRLPGAW